MSALPALVDASPAVLATLVLVLARVAGAAFLAPVLGSEAVPLRIRAAIAFFVALVILPTVAVPEAVRTEAASGGRLLFALAIETVIGVAIGLVAQFLFAGVLLAGELAGVEMGLGMGGLIDPQLQTRTTAIAEWQHVIAILVLLAVDGHHVILRAVAESFDRLPLGATSVSGEGIALALALAGEIFVVGLKIAAPVLVLVVLANVAMGALARLIPQLNVMAVGFPVNIAAGFLALALAQPTVIRLLTSAISGWSATFSGLLGALG
jgi:flagellar biosynthetic protein FliR